MKLPTRNVTNSTFNPTSVDDGSVNEYVYVCKYVRMYIHAYIHTYILEFRPNDEIIHKDPCKCLRSRGNTRTRLLAVDQKHLCNDQPSHNQ